MSLREQLRYTPAPETTASNPFYATKSQPLSLCVETSGGSVSVLPWHCLVSSRYEPGEPERQVLNFPDVEVTLCGLNLWQLTPEISHQRLEWVRPAPGKYLKATGREPCITEISVRPLAEPARTA